MQTNEANVAVSAVAIAGAMAGITRKSSFLTSTPLTDPVTDSLIHVLHLVRPQLCARTVTGTSRNRTFPVRALKLDSQVLTPNLAVVNWFHSKFVNPHLRSRDT